MSRNMEMWIKQWLQPVLQQPVMLGEGCRQGCGHHRHCQHDLIKQHRRRVDQFMGKVSRKMDLNRMNAGFRLLYS